MNTSVKLVLCLSVLFSMSCTKNSNTEEPPSSSDLEALPVLTANPVVGQSYKFSPDGAVCSDGTKATAFFRKGSNNRVVIMLLGGGISTDSYTAARSFTKTAGTGEPSFYSANMSDGRNRYMVKLLNAGMGRVAENNPFSDWTFVCLPYVSGDFHCGTGDYNYIALDGTPQVLHHHGYTNIMAFLDEVLPLIETADTLIVSGCSAGGFGVSIMADDILDKFPKASNITVCNDAGFMIIDDISDVARNVWVTPEHICCRIGSNNISFSCLKALHRDRPKTKILFCCSSYDHTLAEISTYYDTGSMRNPDREALDIFHERLSSFADEFRREIPEGGLLIWNDVIFDPTLLSTQHTILLSPSAFGLLGGNIRVVDWLKNAVNGTIECYGLNLLNDKNSGSIGL